MRIVQFDAVETGLAGAFGGVGEQVGELLREFADVRQLRVGDALPGAVLQCFPFAFVQYLEQLLIGHFDQRGANVCFGMG